MTDLLDRLREEAARQRARQRKHRRGRKVAASLRGYFWMPCPMCGEEFGGHEWRGRLMLPTAKPGMSQGVCPACELELGVQALPFCEAHGHVQTAVLSEGVLTDQGVEVVEVGLLVDLNATPLYAYCLTCGADLPIDT